MSGIGKRETDSRVLIHANDPLDRRPVRPVGGRDFEHQRPRGSLIRDLHSHRKIATESASRPARVRANHEVIPDRRPLLAGRESHVRRGQYQGHNDEDPQEQGAGRTKGGRINPPAPRDSRRSHRRLRPANLPASSAICLEARLENSNRGGEKRTRVQACDV